MTRRHPAFSRAALTLLALSSLTTAGCATRGAGGGENVRSTSAASAPATVPSDPVLLRIRDEGLNRSRVMERLNYLCNVIGPRLTGSPGQLRASEWTRDTLKADGLADARLEPWGPFGRGWTLQRFSLQVIEPMAIPLIAYPRAWSAGFDGPLEAPVVYLNAKTESDLKPYRGTLKGKIVLIGPPRETPAYFEPLATRMDDDRLAKLAASRPTVVVTPPALPGGESAGGGTPGPATAAASSGPTSRRTSMRGRRSASRPTTRPATASAAEGELLVDRQSTGGPASGPATSPMTPLAAQRLADRLLAFAGDEGAALVVGPSLKGDGGTLFVGAAAVPNATPIAATTPASSASGPTSAPATRPRPWEANAPASPPQVTLAVEHYNRLVRMIELGQAPTLRAELQVRFNPSEVATFNTVAEIPGTDPSLADQVVMLGAHLDSWHAGTGATDNAVGSAVVMEAARILRALDLKPRRTIRVALWTGEEEGLLGSIAYVKAHFGQVPDAPTAGNPSTAPATRSTDGTEPDGGANNPATRPATLPIVGLVRGPEYEKLSAYFNIDNGAGKIRGLYAQGNEAAMPVFQQWLRPLADLGAGTVTRVSSGATDHIAFDRVGLPGFGFIQDPLEYNARTHHSNMDTFERLQPDDAKQAATVMAAVVWQAANADDRFPRKPMPPATGPATRPN